MEKFLGDIALVFEIFAVVGGLLILGHNREKGLTTKIAAYLLIVSGITLTSCTAYQQMKNHFSGSYDRRYSQGYHHKKMYSQRDRHEGRKMFRGNRKGRFEQDSQERRRLMRKGKRFDKKTREGDRK